MPNGCPEDGPHAARGTARRRTCYSLHCSAAGCPGATASAQLQRIPVGETDAAMRHSRSLPIVEGLQALPWMLRSGPSRGRSTRRPRGCWDRAGASPSSGSRPRPRRGPGCSGTRGSSPPRSPSTEPVGSGSMPAAHGGWIGEATIAPCSSSTHGHRQPLSDRSARTDAAFGSGVATAPPAPG